MTDEQIIAAMKRRAAALTFEGVFCMDVTNDQWCALDVAGLVKTEQSRLGGINFKAFNVVLSRVDEQLKMKV